MDSIRTIGFLTVDRLVVVPLPQEGKYKVIEGNRRLGAIKTLLDDKEAGEIDIDEKIFATLTKLPVLLLEEPDKTKCEHLGRVLQGVRHVSSIRSWGPYQQAQLIVMMLKEGRDQPRRALQNVPVMGTSKCTTPVFVKYTIPCLICS